MTEHSFAIAPGGRFPRCLLFCVHRQSRRWSTIRSEGRRWQRARPAIDVLHQFVAGKSNMTRRAIGRQARACCPARHRLDFVVEVVKIFNWSERRDLNSGPPVPQTWAPNAQKKSGSVSSRLFPLKLWDTLSLFGSRRISGKHGEAGYCFPIASRKSD
jgi:hypothetical protein